MTTLSADERLAIVAAAIEEAGGAVTGAQPLADPATPEVVAAHWVTANSPSTDVWERVEAVLREHSVDVSAMIPWQPASEGADEVQGE